MRVKPKYVNVLKYTGKDIERLMNNLCLECVHYNHKHLFFNGSRWRGPTGFYAHLKNLSKKDMYQVGYGESMLTYHIMYDFIFNVDVLDQIPLHINDEGVCGCVARWRLGATPILKKIKEGT